MKVLFLANVPSPYRVAFFNELGKQCDLTVLFEKYTSDERDVSWKKYDIRSFKAVFLKGKSINTDTAFCPEVFKYVTDRSYDAVVCCNFSSPTGMLAITAMRLRGIRYYLESDGGYAKDGKGMKERIKRHFISGAKGYFGTAKEHDRYYMTYGAPEERLIRYPFTSVYAQDVLVAPSSEEEKAMLRKKLGMEESKIIVAVGQFIARKGFDILLQSAAKLPKEYGYYIIGGEPTEEYIVMRETLKLSNVHFVGFQNKTALAEYYCAADLLAFPTREDIWGLVINEAMAKGLPIVSSDRCIAALELVENGANGYIVPVEDQKALADRMREILEKPELAKQMGKNNLLKMKEYTIEEMANCHMNWLNQRMQ